MRKVSDSTARQDRPRWKGRSLIAIDRPEKFGSLFLLLFVKLKAFFFAFWRCTNVQNATALFLQMWRSRTSLIFDRTKKVLQMTPICKIASLFLCVIGKFFIFLQNAFLVKEKFSRRTKKRSRSNASNLNRPRKRIDAKTHLST